MGRRLPFTWAVAPPCAQDAHAPCRQVQQIQQGPATMLADAAGADLTDEQKKFMNERKQMATK